MKKINIMYLSPWPVGGFTSFTGHLYRSLIQEGWDVNVLRCNHDNDQQTLRESKHNGFMYRNVSVKTAVKMAKENLTVFGAVCRPEDCVDPDTIPKLMRAGAIVRVASTQEFKQFPHVAALRKEGKNSESRVLVIRESLKQYFDNAIYLPHPFMPFNLDVLETLKRKRACSIAMVATNKHPRLICEANESLPKKLRVQFIGKETTPWIGMGLKKKFPSYETPKGFKGSLEAVQAASKYEFAVDLSVYPNEGGGTQFCFLEAIDAGAINVLHRQWSDAKGDMVEGKNCLAVESVDELKELLRNGISMSKVKALHRGGKKLLANHSPPVIANVLRKLL